MKNMVKEVERLKRQAAENEEARRAEIEELRHALEQEHFDRRDSLNRLRHEFDDFVHKKVEKLIIDADAITGNERRAVSNQQTEQLVEEVARLKDSLRDVRTTWGNLVSNVLNPSSVKTPRPEGS
eukprot:CAMPEP_0117482212 /NCGR_PEP_ID=MMETSP0784-20121206/13303_1 /TAXON_ID=39447 /ORGANISM="" /LENGTH=124 /DNA_ID=CAMNT_0005276701 /DNA_START=33 /DNA_END=407 /DNA_ORIENTATION=+